MFSELATESDLASNLMNFISSAWYDFRGESDFLRPSQHEGHSQGKPHQTTCKSLIPFDYCRQYFMLEENSGESIEADWNRKPGIRLSLKKKECMAAGETRKAIFWLYYTKASLKPQNTRSDSLLTAPTPPSLFVVHSKLLPQWQKHPSTPPIMTSHLSGRCYWLSPKLKVAAHSPTLLFSCGTHSL